MRLDKYLTTLGIGSRTQVKELIKKGKITVNGEKILKPDIHIDENNDEVDLNGVNLKYNKFYYYMLNKPAGVLSAVSDNNCKTVIDLLDVTPKKVLFPVGRLDKDTEGLLLITNDGELSHNLLSPTKHVDKTYYVELNGDLIDSDIELFEKGLDIVVVARPLAKDRSYQEIESALMHLAGKHWIAGENNDKEIYD